MRVPGEYTDLTDEDVAEFSSDCADTGTVVFSFSPLSLLESTEVRVKANGDVGSDKQSMTQIGRTAFVHAIVNSLKLAGL